MEDFGSATKGAGEGILPVVVGWVGGWVGGWVSNSPPPPWGLDICGSVGLPKMWVGGSLQSPPPPPGKKDPGHRVAAPTSGGVVSTPPHTTALGKAWCEASAGAGVGGPSRGSSSTCEQRDNRPAGLQKPRFLWQCGTTPAHGRGPGLLQNN